MGSAPVSTHNPAGQGEEVDRLQAAHAILQAALECQRSGNSAWKKLAKLLELYAHDSCTAVQHQAFFHLAGTALCPVKVTLLPCALQRLHFHCCTPFANCLTLHHHRTVQRFHARSAVVRPSSTSALAERINTHTHIAVQNSAQPRTALKRPSLRLWRPHASAEPAHHGWRH